MSPEGQGMIDDERGLGDYSPIRESGPMPENREAMNAPAASAAPPPQAPDGAAPSRTAPREASLGEALRTVYRQTVEEDIPAEMLDLLKRLD